MFCSKCGQAVEESASFCPKCGNNLSQKTETIEQGVNGKKSEVTQIVMVMPSGTAPLILGLLGIFGFLIPIVKYFTGILSLIAIFVGASQRKRLKNAGLPSGKATAGLVLGVIAVLSTIISIIFSAIFIGSLFSGLSSGSTYKPSRTVNNYSYVEPVKPKVTENDLDGTWVGGYKEDMDRYLFEFNGEYVAFSEKNINKYTEDYRPIYSRQYKGSFVNKSPSSISIKYTHVWRNGSWEEIDGYKGESFGISDLNKNSFKLGVNGTDIIFKRQTIINYE